LIADLVQLEWGLSLFAQLGIERLHRIRNNRSTHDGLKALIGIVQKSGDTDISFGLGLESMPSVGIW